MITYPDSGDAQPDETSGAVLTAAAHRSELRTAAHALTLAARRVQQVLIHAPGDTAALDKALAELDAHRAVLAGLRTVQVNNG